MYAVQFHPESVMTQDGYRLLANWLKVCGQENAVERSKGLQPGKGGNLKEVLAAEAGVKPRTSSTLTWSSPPVRRLSAWA